MSDPEEVIQQARSVTQWPVHEGIRRHPPREPSAWGFILKVLAVLLILGLAGIVLPL